MAKHRRWAVAVMLVVGTLIAFQRPLVAGPEEVNLQARLTDGQGKPLADGTIAKLTFRMYSDVGLTQFLWGEAHLNVAVLRGVVSVRLGNGDQRVSASGSVTAGRNPLSAS